MRRRPGRTDAANGQASNIALCLESRVAFGGRRAASSLALGAALIGSLLAGSLLCPLKARTRVDIVRDVQYGEVDGQKLMLDAYVPWGPSMDRPAIIFVHGGSWMGGDKSGYHSFALKMANRGFVGFSVNYRLANKWGNKWPAQLNDVQRAVRWVRAHARQYGVDPDRIGAMGESAGGHLVAMLGLTDTWDNSDTSLSSYSSRVNCVVDLFGPTDFWLTPADKETKAARDVHLMVFGSYKEENPQFFVDASPVTHVDHKAVPFLIFHGTRDETVHLRQSQRLYDALCAVGDDATFIPMPGEGHGFHQRANLRIFNAAVFDFFDRHLKPPLEP